MAGSLSGRRIFGLPLRFQIGGHPVFTTNHLNPLYEKASYLLPAPVRFRPFSDRSAKDRNSDNQHRDSLRPL
jgi:hypothetical protein